MRKSTAQFFSWLWRRTAFLRSPVGLAILAVAFVGLRLVWVHLQRPAHLEANAAAYGSIRKFYGPARMNHNGSQFIYVASADGRGRSLFLCDTVTGEKRQIIEDRQGVRAWNDDFDIHAGPWSPDDTRFLCVVSNRMMVCSTDTDQAKVVIDDKPYSEAVWLTSSRFAYVRDGTNLCLGWKAGDDKWEHKILQSRHIPLTSLTAISPNAVAWLENDDAICRADLVESESGGSIVASRSTRQASGGKPDTTMPPTNGLALWLDASRLQHSDQEPVLELADLSRRKNNAVRNGTPPVFNGTNSPRALNGKGTIHFGWLDSATNGTGLKTRAPLGVAGAAPRSVFVVMRREADRPMMVNMGDTSAHGALFAVEWSERLFLPTGWWADNYADLASTNWHLLQVVYDGTSQKGYVDGLLRCVANANLNTVERGVEIGFRGGSEPKAAEGDFAELLVYDRALSVIERQHVEAYLGGKWFGSKSSSPQTPVVWFAGLDGMTGLDYSKESGMLLISRTKNGHDSVWQLDIASGPNAQPTQLIQRQSVRDAQWAGANRFIYASHLDNRSWLTLMDSSGGQKHLLEFWGSGNFDWFRMSPDQKQLFVFGNISNAPAAGIWQRDLESDAWRPVISSSDHVSDEVRNVAVSHNVMPVPGGQVTCTIYRPADFDRRKKYPLVLGDTMITDPIHGESFMTSMAACGALVAVVERPWWPVGLEQWVEHVQAAYDQLKQDSTVDTRRVYLFAASAETHYLSRLVATNPAPWRGLILLNPGRLPDFSKSPRFQLRPKILLNAGGAENLEDRFKKYQQEALAHGAVVEFFTHPGETHRMVGTDGKLARARILKRFIFEE
jgi:hypothetical protein